MKTHAKQSQNHNKDERPVGLHLYETIQPSSQTDAKPDVDPAGYTVMQNGMNGVTAERDITPTSTTGLLPLHDPGYMVMNKQLSVENVENDKVDEINENSKEGEKPRADVNE